MPNLQRRFCKIIHCFRILLSVYTSTVHIFVQIWNISSSPLGLILTAGQPSTLYAKKEVSAIWQQSPPWLGKAPEKSQEKTTTFAFFLYIYFIDDLHEGKNLANNFGKSPWRVKWPIRVQDSILTLLLVGRGQTTEKEEKTYMWYGLYYWNFCRKSAMWQIFLWTIFLNFFCLFFSELSSFALFDPCIW